MSVDATDPPHDLPSGERSAYEYSVECSFQALHSPNIELVVQMLQKHQDYVGFFDKIELLSDEGKELLASAKFWDPFAKKAIISIKCCLTGDEKELGKMKKQLIAMERLIIREFASSNADRISSEKFLPSGCQALLNVLTSAFNSILKHDMCQGVTMQDRSVAGVVSKAFSSTDADIEACFASAGDAREVRSLMECLYYVAG